MDEYQSISAIARKLKTTRFTIRAAIRRAKRTNVVIRQFKLPYNNYTSYNIYDIIHFLFSIKWRVMTESEKKELEKILELNIQECFDKAKDK